MDQAETLRRQMLQSQRGLGKVIAVVSGKEGVGKSNFSTSFATEISSKGHSVLLLNMDVGKDNFHSLIGQHSEKTIFYCLESDRSIHDVVQNRPGGFSYISGGSDLSRMIEWKDIEINRLIHGLEELQKEYDYLIFNMGVGDTAKGHELIMAADEVIVITTAEPTSIMEAYSMMKFIHMKDEENKFSILCNRVVDETEGEVVLQRLRLAMERFLQKEIHLLGSLPEDLNVRKAVSNRTPFILNDPSTPAAKTLKKIVHHYLDQHTGEAYANSDRFVQRLSTLFSRR
ncbi:MinD/ParA family protein [Jeotgalibacillus marinus]|uniref:MinD/ParA family protein n=1 Tax=Jeotgalibacillus marinus TaxID=86667 RepID=A0ABV3Q1Q4_9BACL